jgi:hypothetical protein
LDKGVAAPLGSFLQVAARSVQRGPVAIVPYSKAQGASA